MRVHTEYRFGLIELQHLFSGCGVKKTDTAGVIGLHPSGHDKGGSRHETKRQHLKPLTAVKLAERFCLRKLPHHDTIVDCCSGQVIWRTVIKHDLTGKPG